ncbi:glycoside hydrolase family 18 and carbohydrate-binding module family 5 protein [Clavulina sp. PMI_390]|nr:glycoside hydrolase family 18 and carbohydrate-binding module family 5 protein [Clavulina sp. PMI_390]
MVPRLLHPALALLVCFFLALTASATHGRDNTRRRHHDHLAQRGPHSKTYNSVGYYPNYAIYGRSFPPSSIVPKTLTHILYAFADCDATTGQVMLTDLWADQQIHYAGDSWSEPGNNLYGNFKQLYLMKQAQRNLKVLLSIGGFTYSQDGHFNFISNPTARATFVSSAIQLLEDNGLDGLDVDFEYPTAAQKADFVSLMAELRAGLDAHAHSKGDHVPYQLTAAVPAGAANYVNFSVKSLDHLLTFWNLMAYDYAGPWSNVSDDQANLYRGHTKEGVDTDSTLRWYLEHGASCEKMNIGIPLYGRAFENTAGIQKPFSGVGSGSWADGVWDVKVLPFAGAKVTNDLATGASYSYDSAKKELISYDTPDIVREKARYVQARDLAGTMYWDLSSDYVGANSLVGAATGVFGHLDQTPNHLSYPGSQFDNVKSCMGSCVATTTTATATTTATTSHASTITTMHPGDPCKVTKPWDHTHSYVKGNTVLFDHCIWTAERNSRNEMPHGGQNFWGRGKHC